MAAARSLAAVPDQPERVRPPDLRDAVRTAVAGMKWLGPQDDATVALAHRLADQIESAQARQAEYDALAAGTVVADMALFRRLQRLEVQCDATKAVARLGPQLHAVLRELSAREHPRGGPPAKQSKAGGRLAQLRAEVAGKHDS